MIDIYSIKKPSSLPTGGWAPPIHEAMGGHSFLLEQISITIISQLYVAEGGHRF